MLPARDGVREVEAQLNRYLDRLRRRIRWEAVVVAGSRARGSHCSDSDIDLVVVSEAFEGLTRGERTELLLQDWYDIPTLQPQGFTAAEIFDPQPLFLWDALADGKPWDDGGVWQTAVRAFQRRILEGELSRTPGGWRLESPASKGM